MLAADAHIQHSRQLCAGAVGQAVDRADDRFGESGEMPIGFAADVRSRGHFFRRGFHHLHDVAAGGKGARPGAGKNYHARFIIVFDLGEFFIQLAGELVAEGVEFLGAIESDDGDFIDAFGEDILVTHVISPLVHRTLQQKGD